MRRYKKNKIKSPSARLRYPLTKSIALVGLMGSGKTTVGVRLARKLGVSFVDSDAEIEVAAGHTVSEIFEKFGEDDFRNGERKVIDRLISDTPTVLGTGGGAFMDRETRRNLKERTITVWLKANIDLLVERTSRRNTRPLLQAGDPEKILRDLAHKRYPIYGQADITVETGIGPHEKVVHDIIWKLNEYLAKEKKQDTPEAQKKSKKSGRRYPAKRARPPKNSAETSSEPKK